MKEFLGEDFLLNSSAAVRLYNEYARDIPVFDYHNHLPVQEIAEDRRFGNLTEIWLKGDHYKWRAMRARGVEERFITGDADDYAKFLKWAETVPAAVRNPLYHWTHMELKHPFGITGRQLCPETAADIYAACNQLLQTPPFSTRNLIINANVKILCTTDDPTDDLTRHLALAADTAFPVKVLPAFRPDKALNITRPAAFNQWLDMLETAAGMSIKSYTDLLAALEKRVDFFHAAGCRISDHGLEAPYSAEFRQLNVERSFRKARSGTAVTDNEAEEFQAALLFELARQYYRKGWVMQLHMGVMRNINSRAYGTLGPDTGFDTIGDFRLAFPLIRFLDRLESRGELPKTILYSIQPGDNDLMATLSGCFQDSTARGKMQFGAAWWFNDHKQGMMRQLDALSANGLLSGFVGMLTDSRSFLSFSRHDYFRRILCDVLGTDMENGELPADYSLLGRMVRDICWHNAVNYFGIDNAG